MKLRVIYYKFLYKARITFSYIVSVFKLSFRIYDTVDAIVYDTYISKLNANANTPHSQNMREFRKIEFSDT